MRLDRNPVATCPGKGIDMFDRFLPKRGRPARGHVVTWLLAPVGALLFTPDVPARDQQAIRCQQGYVWREAYRGDYVCVSPASRDRNATDNAQAASRRQPGGGAYGPNTCRSGYVWREARPGDQVCVTPDRRDATQRENQLAESRRVRGTRID